MTDEEWVKQYHPHARVVLRRGYHKPTHRVRGSGWLGVYLGRRWCRTPERAWAAARARLTHRLLDKMDE